MSLSLEKKTNKQKKKKKKKKKKICAPLSYIYILFHFQKEFVTVLKDVVLFNNNTANKVQIIIKFHVFNEGPPFGMM